MTYDPPHFCVPFEEPEDLGPLGGHAVLVVQHRQQDCDAADQLDPSPDMPHVASRIS